MRTERQACLWGERQQMIALNEGSTVEFPRPTVEEEAFFTRLVQIDTRPDPKMVVGGAKPPAPVKR